MAWMEDPGRLQSMGSLGVRHDWVTSVSLFTFMHWRRKWQPTPVFLPGESQGRGSLVGCRLWGRTESDTTELTATSQQPVGLISNLYYPLPILNCSRMASWYIISPQSVSVLLMDNPFHYALPSLSINVSGPKAAERIQIQGGDRKGLLVPSTLSHSLNPHPIAECCALPTKALQRTSFSA